MMFFEKCVVVKITVWLLKSITSLHPKAGVDYEPWYNYPRTPSSVIDSSCLGSYFIPQTLARVDTLSLPDTASVGQCTRSPSLVLGAGRSWGYQPRSTRNADVPRYPECPSIIDPSGAWMLEEQRAPLLQSAWNLAAVEHKPQFKHNQRPGDPPDST